MIIFSLKDLFVFTVTNYLQNRTDQNYTGQYFIGHHSAKLILVQLIVLFKSLRNSKRRNKENFTLKSNLNKIKLCGGGGQHHLVFIISTL